MKVNTDGVLLGVLVDFDEPSRILDVGTGTGVIALMLAQRFPSAHVTAVEIDEHAAQTAKENFNRSVFNDRLTAVNSSFSSYFQGHHPGKFDLIVSNPPFFIDSLKSPDAAKSVARHTDQIFFESLLREAALNLRMHGLLALIVPLRLSGLLEQLAAELGLNLQKKISICSFTDSIPHREILVFGREEKQTELTTFVIYAEQKEYSSEYREVLKDFLTIF